MKKNNQKWKVIYKDSKQIKKNILVEERKNLLNKSKDFFPNLYSYHNYFCAEGDSLYCDSVKDFINLKSNHFGLSYTKKRILNILGEQKLVVNFNYENDELKITCLPKLKEVCEKFINFYTKDNNKTKCLLIITDMIE